LGVSDIGAVPIWYEVTKRN